MRMEPRRWGRGGLLAVGAAVLLVVAACGSGGTGTGSTSGGGTATNATFVVADTSSVQKLDPAVMTNFLDFSALGMVYQTLVTLNSKLEVAPELATSWSTGSGGTTLTFNLRKNVKFDDGSTLTSQDVKATFERILEPSTGAAAASYLASVQSISTPSSDQVVLHLSHPDNSLIFGLASDNLAIVPGQAITGGTLKTQPDGTGPYKFSSYQPNNSFTVTRNPHYWGGTPTLKEIVFRTIPDEQSIASALQAGTVQMGLLTEPQVVHTLQGSSAAVKKELSLNYRALMMQSTSGPLANGDARLAIQCALNRSAILQAAVQGQGKVVGPVPQGPFASDPKAGTCGTQNLSQARSYLQKAGMPNGFSFTVLTSNDLDGTSNAQAVTIQNELAQVGIHMSIDNVASSAYIQDWLKGQFQGALAENGASPSPYIMYGRYFGKGASLAIPAGYSSPELQNLLQQAVQTQSTSQQQQLYSQFTDNLVNNAVWIWLFNGYQYYGLSGKVKGFTPLPSGSLSGLTQTTLASS